MNTRTLVSIIALVTLGIVLASVVIATVHNKAKSQQHQFGGGSAHSSCTMDETSEGPFPCCVGLAGEACISHIESVAPDLVEHCFIIKPGVMHIMDYDTGRVWVYVNENGIVENSPSRG
mmetsp:Transcript_31666/g.38788  ORF Transcript_31666/g.38788 Transcript_31666/m.38788 type:complete len:119 (-) Transcript_31666:101-457(-)